MRWLLIAVLLITKVVILKSFKLSSFFIGTMCYSLTGWRWRKATKMTTTTATKDHRHHILSFHPRLSHRDSLFFHGLNCSRHFCSADGSFLLHQFDIMVDVFEAIYLVFGCFTDRQTRSLITKPNMWPTRLCIRFELCWYILYKWKMSRQMYNL
jgi:hypothetical protein